MIPLAAFLKGRAAFSLTASNVTETDSGPSASGTVTSTTDDPNTTPTGGADPVTYSWAHQSTSSGNTPTISSATAQNPTWSATVGSAIDSVSSWKVTATDAVGRTAEVTITVTLDWENTS